MVDRLEKGRGGAEPDLGGAQRHRLPHQGRRLPPWRGRWSAWPTRSPISTTTLRMPLRGGVIYPMDIPWKSPGVLGFTHGERINALVVDVILASRDQDSIQQSEEAGEAMSLLAGVYV